jgi:hypothetical protein
MERAAPPIRTRWTIEIAMAHPAVDKSGKLIVNRLRDNAIKHFDLLATQHYAAPGLKPLQGDLASLTKEQRNIVRRCVISSIDNALHGFLFGLVEANDADEGITVIVDGQNIAELSDGLHGEQFTDEGWIAKFGAFDESGEASG